ncbi:MULTISPECIES: helix-turn-helix domain-containing protein [unclassified Sphingomonas]|uniref:helix-turn-helix domain-containing protein n=1 Tax=unclassified Sphingomonas TaxID=196159 RepID=UPI0009EABA7B|nr:MULTISPECIES: helix-turn-helix domain-containing protein [unclassified Sphingomonas]TCP66044.1 helix-turn-helix protein [Sphingomonas sp. PP-CE-1G-424]
MAVFTLGQATAQALGAVAGRQSPRRPSPGLSPGLGARSGGPHRTGAPVLRDSIEAGTFETLFFTVPAKGETDKLLRIARRTLDAGRQLRREARAGDRILSAAERRIILLTAAAVRVYEEILTLARLNKGRVFPSYDHLSKATSLGRATIARALHILEDIGFLVRQRRFKRVEAEGPGPRYRQTSNVYRPTLPQRVLAYLPRWMQPAPTPDDVVQQQADRIDDTAAMLSGLSCRDLAAVTVGGQLGKMLAKLGAGVDRIERESQIESQPLQS